MAISRSKKPPISVPLLAFTTTYFMLLHTVNSADGLHFFFDKFDVNQKDLILQGDASIASSNVLQLTKVDNNGNPLSGSVGRALYSAPIRLWDSSGGDATFTSSFSFVISTRGSDTPADGLTFFLASVNSTIPPGSGGALLGLFSNANIALNNSRNEVVDFKADPSNGVVAVEFDTYPNVNLGDPNYRHIGINVNSIRSREFRRWNWQNGQVVSAQIYYDNVFKSLRATARFPDGGFVDFRHNIDLATVLPQWVRVGFSASTGQYAQTNNIQAWSFITRYRRSRNNVQEKDGYIASVV